MDGWALCSKEIEIEPVLDIEKWTSYLGPPLVS